MSWEITFQDLLINDYYRERLMNQNQYFEQSNVEYYFYNRYNILTQVPIFFPVSSRYSSGLNLIKIIGRSP